MRTVSATYKAAIFAQETTEVFILLVTINHVTLASPIRISSDGVDTDSNGITYSGGIPFEFIFPNDDDKAPVTKIVVDNLDRAIVQAVREADTRPSITVEQVLASDPDTVEISLTGFELVSTDYDVFSVQGIISKESFLAEPFPAGRMDPTNFPGIFPL